MSAEAFRFAGAIATATGAPLGDAEFDVHSWLRERFVELGCPEDNAVPFTGHALRAALDGYELGAVLSVLDNLTDAFVTVVGFDAERCVLDSDAISHGLRLVEGIIEQGDGTLVVLLPAWSARALREGAQLGVSRDQGLRERHLRDCAEEARPM